MLTVEEIDRLVALARDGLLLKRAVNESASNCACDTDGHVENCPTTDVAQWLIDLRQRLADVEKLADERLLDLGICERKLTDAEARATALHGDGSGHLYRCARINGKWACDKACRMSQMEARVRELNDALAGLYQCEHGDEETCGCRAQAWATLARRTT